MLKKLIQATLQRLFGFERYLFWFSRFKIHTLHWDPQEKEGDFTHFLTLLSPTDLVLDIGANVGIMTVHLANACPQGIVHAFEPIPDNFRALEKICQHYRLPNVYLHPIALGAERGEVSMSMPVIKGVKMQGLSHVSHAEIEGYDTDTHSYQVPQLPLSELPQLSGKKVHAIKMDVENYEQFVLAGAEEILKAHHPIIYTELWDNENRSACIRLLEGLGYQTLVLQAGELIPFQPGLHSQHNFFFLPQK
jgi:FkbM family methyltransferase